MMRGLLNLATAMSLVLCVATAALWACGPATVGDYGTGPRLVRAARQPATRPSIVVVPPAGPVSARQPISVPVRVVFPPWGVGRRFRVVLFEARAYAEMLKSPEDLSPDVNLIAVSVEQITQPADDIGLKWITHVPKIEPPDEEAYEVMLTIREGAVPGTVRLRAAVLADQKAMESGEPVTFEVEE